jgi:hypothetical protein
VTSKVRAGTTTTGVVWKILVAPRDFPWLSMRDIKLLAEERGTPIEQNAAASALANLEAGGRVEVRRGSRPFRYRAVKDVT